MSNGVRQVLLLTIIEIFKKKFEFIHAQVLSSSDVNMKIQSVFRGSSVNLRERP